MSRVPCDIRPHVEEHEMKGQVKAKKPDGFWEPGLATDIKRSKVQASVWDFDRTVSQAEATWGHDRLPYLVSADTRARWWRAVEALNVAVKENDPEKVEPLVHNLVRGVGRMVDEAKAAGHEPLDPGIWTVRGPSGKTYRVVRAWPEHSATFDDDITTFTLEEVGRLLDTQFHAVVAVKEQWPGATVTTSRSQLAEELNDDIPF